MAKKCTILVPHSCTFSFRRLITVVPFFFFFFLRCRSRYLFFALSKSLPFLRELNSVVIVLYFFSRSDVLLSFQAMNGVRRSQSSDVLTEAEEVSGFLLELGHFFHEWRFALPDVLNLLQVNSIPSFGF